MLQDHQMRRGHVGTGLPRLRTHAFGNYYDQKHWRMHGQIESSDDVEPGY